jgi:hypothetical protein
LLENYLVVLWLFEVEDGEFFDLSVRVPIEELQKLIVRLEDFSFDLQGASLRVVWIVDLHVLLQNVNSDRSADKKVVEDVGELCSEVHHISSRRQRAQET